MGISADFETDRNKNNKRKPIIQHKSQATSGHTPVHNPEMGNCLVRYRKWNSSHDIGRWCIIRTITGRRRRLLLDYTQQQYY